MKIKIEKKVDDRIKKSLKNFKNVIKTAKEKDINESDTVTIITDILVEVLGYNKYEEITREYAIKNTYCDLAVKIDNKLKILIEVKAIGITLKEDHIRQATSYGANQGLRWVVLTNGEYWSVYHLKFNQSVKIEEVINFNLLNDDTSILKKNLFSISKEGLKKNTISQIYEYQSIINKYCISALIISDDVIKLVIKKLKKLSNNSKIENENILRLLKEEVIKREIIEYGDFDVYKRKITRMN